MLVHVWHKLEGHLYLFKVVANDSVISTATGVCTGVLAARSLLNKLSHSLINICVCLLFWRSHHAAFDVRNHEKDERHQKKDGNSAKQGVDLIFLGWVSFFTFGELVDLHRVLVNHIFKPRGRFTDSRISHLTHI